jgi:predicted metal-dependent peptidase
MQMIDPGLEKELNRTKVALMRTKDAAFFTTIVFSLKFAWDDKIPTAATNGYWLKWNPDFFLKATKEQRVFVLVHEACHVAYDHMGRVMGILDKAKTDAERRWLMDLWNKAADHVINLMLKARGFQMWDWVLADPRFTDMSAEQVFKILKDENSQQPNPMQDVWLPGNEPGSGDQPGDKPGQCSAPQAQQPGQGPTVPGVPTPAEHQRHIQDILARAAIQAKIAGEPGSIPAEVELFLQRLQRPKLPWTTILKRLVGARAKTGYSWLKPNRRYFPQFHLPSAWGSAPSELDFYVDISSSVSDWQFTRFVSEIAGALKQFNLTRIRIVQFNTRITSIDYVKNLKELSKVKFIGRGGTRITEVLDDIEKTKPELALVFTDGRFGWDRKSLKGDVVWLINDNPRFVPQFGKAIHFKTE